MLRKHYIVGMTHRLSSGDIIDAIKRSALSSNHKLLLAHEAVDEGKLACLEVSTRHAGWESTCCGLAADRVCGHNWCFLPDIQNGIRLLMLSPDLKPDFLATYYHELAKHVLPPGRTERQDVTKPLSECDARTGGQVRKCFPTAREGDLYVCELHDHRWAIYWPDSCTPQFKHLVCLREDSWVWPPREIGEPVQPGSGMP